MNPNQFGAIVIKLIRLKVEKRLVFSSCKYPRDPHLLRFYATHTYVERQNEVHE